MISDWDRKEGGKKERGKKKERKRKEKRKKERTERTRHTKKGTPLKNRSSSRLVRYGEPWNAGLSYGLFALKGRLPERTSFDAVCATVLKSWMNLEALGLRRKFDLLNCALRNRLWRGVDRRLNNCPLFLLVAPPPPRTRTRPRPKFQLLPKQIGQQTQQNRSQKG